MSDTNWWDACVLSVRWGEQGWQVRVGMFCVALLTWMVVDLVQWLVTKKESKPPSEQPSHADQPSP